MEIKLPPQYHATAAICEIPKFCYFCVYNFLKNAYY